MYLNNPFLNYYGWLGLYSGGDDSKRELDPMYVEGLAAQTVKADTRPQNTIVLRPTTTVCREAGSPNQLGLILTLKIRLY